MRVTLAAHGVLFLEELAEFIAPLLDGLRRPLEESGALGELRKGARRVLNIASPKGSGPVPDGVSGAGCGSSGASL
jgi:hypothetical protein